MYHNKSNGEKKLLHNGSILGETMNTSALVCKVIKVSALHVTHGNSYNMWPVNILNVDGIVDTLNI